MSALGGFTESTFTAEGTTRRVFRAGSGPAVVVVHEIPGVTPLVADFGRWVADLGCTAVLPSLFGEPGRPPTVGYGLRSMAAGCVSREFATLALRQTSPVTSWLRELAAAAHAECGGPGVGVVGMCFTGGFALGMMVDDRVLAPVLSQPSLPFPISARHRSDLGVSDGDLARVKERVAGGACVLGLRFTGDKLAPNERFDALRRALGEGFVAVEIPDDAGRSRRPHSVLTEDLVDEPGNPTRDALEQVLAFLRDRLLA